MLGEAGEHRSRANLPWTWKRTYPGLKSVNPTFATRIPPQWNWHYSTALNHGEHAHVIDIVVRLESGKWSMLCGPKTLFFSPSPPKSVVTLDLHFSSTQLRLHTLYHGETGTIRLLESRLVCSYHSYSCRASIDRGGKSKLTLDLVYTQQNRRFGPNLPIYKSFWWGLETALRPCAKGACVAGDQFVSVSREHTTHTNKF